MKQGSEIHLRAHGILPQRRVLEAPQPFDHPAREEFRPLPPRLRDAAAPKTPACPQVAAGARVYGDLTSTFECQPVDRGVVVRSAPVEVDVRARRAAVAHGALRQVRGIHHPPARAVLYQLPELATKHKVQLPQLAPLFVPGNELLLLLVRGAPVVERIRHCKFAANRSHGL